MAVTQFRFLIFYIRCSSNFITLRYYLRKKICGTSFCNLVPPKHCVFQFFSLFFVDEVVNRKNKFRNMSFTKISLVNISYFKLGFYQWELYILSQWELVVSKTFSRVFWTFPTVRIFTLVEKLFKTIRFFAKLWNILEKMTPVICLCTYTIRKIVVLKISKSYWK